MEYEFAPLEGVTDAVYRRNHVRFYPGLDRYYTPFISPTRNHVFTSRQLRELSADNNPGVPLVLQLLGKNADDLLWAAKALSDMGFAEINLNLGCPSRTVTAKGKGAGLLADPDSLDRLLERLFSRSPAAISVKTRLGIHTAEAFSEIVRVYDRYPIRRLIIHPRTADQLYTGSVDRKAFADALAETRLPVCYNGDLRAVSDIEALSKSFPSVGCVMLGRGLVAEPGLLSDESPKTLAGFHEALCAEYPVVFGNTGSALHRMKAIWAFRLAEMPDGAKWHKRLIKTKRWDDYLSLSAELLTLRKEA